MPLREIQLGDLRDAFVAAVVLGAFSAVADWVWARYIPNGAVVPGVVHGVVVFVLLAIVVGRAARAPGAAKRLLLTLPIAGLLIAAGFYPLAYGIGYLGALLVAWIAMWLALALLRRRARGGNENVARSLLRGVLAALASGLAFWAVSGMWTDPAAHTSYLLRFAYWTFAFLPGFLALFWGQRRA
ncbi:MAG: hypothetical protein ACE5GX_13795 [Thermoanaerobaculia bacterium]